MPTRTKVGHATFLIRDPRTGREWSETPAAYLTTQQAKQMAFQPDMLQEFAHFLKERYNEQGAGKVEAYVSWNGRPSRLLIDPTVDLSREPLSLHPKPWILD